MKLNKTLILTALVAGSVFAGSSALQAQDATNKPAGDQAAPVAPGGAMRARGGFDMISKQLDLTDDQKPKVKPIIDDEQKQLRDLRTDTTVAQADKRTKAKDIRDAATAKLKDILTPEQLAKWDKMGPGNRRPPGAPTPPPAADAAPKADATK